MVKTKDLPKTYEISIEELEKSFQIVKEADKNSTFQTQKEKMKKFELSDKQCIICKTSLVKFYKKEYEQTSPWTKTGQKAHSWWSYQGQHCTNCGLKYEFEKPDEDLK